MAIRSASAIWHGNLREGKGRIRLESGALDAIYSFYSRFDEGKGTNPEELIGAAHAGCFSMALANSLSQEGYVPKSIQTRANVHFEKVGEGYRITVIELNIEAEVPGVSKEKFLERAEVAKQNCPVSKALKGIEIKLHAKLLTELISA